MNQEVIGKFISECRKNKNLTQAELAEKLDVTDRAVSKWERGRGLPDASIMLELCSLLGITVNELLSGRRINMDEVRNSIDDNLIELKKENDDYAKKIFLGEIILIITSTLFLFFSVFLYENNLNNFLRVILVIISLLLFIICIIYSFNVEKNVGYYECMKCHHKYKPSFISVFFSLHSGYSKRLKCPKCGKISWNKKVCSK